jgi:hypothetical protein
VSCVWAHGGLSAGRLDIDRDEFILELCHVANHRAGDVERIDDRLGIAIACDFGPRFGGPSRA